MPDTGPRAPARTLVAVRAMVPVTQMPPKIALAILAAPCATSSQLERCRAPLMLSATTAESRLSMAPSSVKLSAAGRSCMMRAGLRSGRCGAGSVRAMPPNLVPIVSTGRCSSAAATDASATAMRKLGQCGRQMRQATMIAMAAKSEGDRSAVDGGQRRAECLQLGQQIARLLARERQPEQVPDLAGEDDDADAGREADRHRKGNELDERAEAQPADRHQHDAGQQRRRGEPVQPVSGDGGGDEHDEGARRSADLEAAAAKQRDEEAADDSGIEPALGRDAGGNGNGHAERQRDDGDGEAGKRIGTQAGKIIALAPDGHDLRHVELGKAGTGGDARHVSLAPGGLLQPHAPAARRARHVAADQLHARALQRLDHFGQAVDQSAHIAVARFHALDGGQRDAGQLGQRTLVDAEHGARGTHLSGGHHATHIRCDS